MARSQHAEDLVQATFERAMQHPPQDRSRPWRPCIAEFHLQLATRKLAAIDFTPEPP